AARRAGLRSLAAIRRARAGLAPPLPPLALHGAVRSMCTATMPQLPMAVNLASARQHRAEGSASKPQHLSENLAQCRDRLERACLFETRPLHAHDEMIDAKQRAIARNFVLHERLIADNETVLDELLERLLEGLRTLRLLVEAPGRISGVF